MMAGSLRRGPGLLAYSVYLSGSPATSCYHATSVRPNVASRAEMRRLQRPQ